MERIIKDKANKRDYLLKDVEICVGVSGRGLFSEWYWEVRVNYMDESNTSGTWVSVARFLFDSENPDLPPNVKTSEISREQALEFAKLCAQQLALDLKVDVIIQ